jgi:hypothetical protein
MPATLPPAAHADKSKPYIPLAGIADDGFSTEQEATATCFCGAVQLKFVRLPSVGSPVRFIYHLPAANPRAGVRQLIHL